MAKILTYRRWSYTLHLFRRWLSNKFSAIKIDLTPVEEKLDTTVAQESTSQEILTAVQSVPAIPLTNDQVETIINHVINS